MVDPLPTPSANPEPKLKVHPSSRPAHTARDLAIAGSVIFVYTLFSLNFATNELFSQFLGRQHLIHVHDGLAIFFVSALLFFWFTLRRIKELRRTIKERQEIAEALARSEEKYRTIFENIQDVYYEAAIDGRIIEISNSINKNTSFTREDLLGHSIAEIYAQPKKRYELLKKLLQEEKVVDYEFHLKGKNGQVEYFSLNSVLVRDETGKPSKIIGSMRNISARREVEAKLKQHQEELEVLVKQRTRELRTINRKLTQTISELESRSRETALLNKLGDQLQACNTEQETFALVAHTCHLLLPQDSGQLCLVEENQRLLTVVSSWGELIADGHEFDPEQCWAIRHRKPHLVHNPKLDPLCPHVQTSPTYGAMCLPIIYEGNILGMMYIRLGAFLDDHYPDQDFDQIYEAKKLLLSSLLERYALSLSNLRLRENLRWQSIRDPLTNLYNRRHMEESLQREGRRALRHHTSLGIIMMDVDHFKPLNDTYGHEAGDFILRELGQLLSQRRRGEDIACRYGGEEFTLIAPGAALEDIEKMAEELRQYIASEFVVSHHGNRHTITVSLGVAVFPDHGATIEEALSLADSALYQAKREGRNRVVVAS